MEDDEALLDIGSLNYDFGGSEKKLEKAPKTRISDWDMDVQGPGFQHGFDHVLGHFLKTKLKNIIDLAPILPPLGDLDEDELELTWSGVGPDWNSTVHSRMSRSASRPCLAR